MTQNQNCGTLFLMASADDILEKLAGTVFSARRLRKQGLSYPQINELLEAGKLYRIRRGIYQVAGDELDEEEQFRAATLQVGNPSAICLLSALAFYHLTDEIPKRVWVLVPFNKRSRARGLKLFRSRNPHWRVGIEKEVGYKITTLERTLVDCLVHPRLRMPTATQALKRALQDKRVSLDKLLRIASSLNCHSRILPLVETYL